MHAATDRPIEMNAGRGLSLSTVVLASDDQISCEVADEVVLLSVANGQYYGLNPVGASIWRLIQTPRSLTEIRDELLVEYSDVSSETCTSEVLAFAANMLDLGLIARQ